MAALVQTIPQQTGTVTLLQTRPSSASGAASFASANHPLSLMPSSRGQTMALGGGYTSGNGSSYRGHQAAAVAPYAFTSTPGLVSTNSQPQRQSTSAIRLDSQNSTSSALQTQSTTLGVPPRLPHLTAGSVSSSSSNSSYRSYISQDDSILSSSSRTTDLPRRPLSTINLPTNASLTNLSSPTSPKPSPDRYRRGKSRSEGAGNAQPAGSQNISAAVVPARGSSTDATLQGNLSNTDPSGSMRTVSQAAGHVRVASADNARPEKVQSPELAKRYRRRSWANIDFVGGSRSKDQSPLDLATFTLPELNFTSDPPRPRSAHSRNGSSESLHSNRSSNQSQSERDSPVVKPASSQEAAKSSVSPPTPETGKRSPLSNQISAATEAQASAPSPQSMGSPAAQRLADINRMAPKKQGKSRLRRAFSFGSAAELRKASAQNLANRRELADTDKNGSDGFGEELDPEQAAIAAQQEANGLGESIYTHQGNFFSGSTDNLSISSTASSASVMLRKMGRGMKKSGRSLVGLFRPKSFVSAPSDSMTIEPTAPQVSVVNIEAERKTVIANPDPHDQAGGGTVFPKIETPPQEAPVVTTSSDPVAVESIRARKSIMGGEKERAEVLAAVKKGILKRSGSSSPLAQPANINSPGGLHNDSPHSSAPSTPDEHLHRTGHRRSDCVKIEGEDYFLSVSRFNTSDSKSAPITPQPLPPKTIVFSPRIQFHETWPSGEYDRRGDIATCNRLTPLLAQQIKEELNTFKMEMEVHETSKVYTHFL